MSADYIVPLDALTIEDVPRVGGKNSSLGEMIRHLTGAGVKVPGGFATTAQAFWDFLDHIDLRARIHARLAALDVADVTALAVAGAEIRAWVEESAALPDALESGLRTAYAALGNEVSVAVRSSATAEDLPDALARRMGAPDPFSAYNEELLYRDLVRIGLEVPPGTRITYSDLGVGLLGFALGKKLGGFKTALEQRVVKPLALADTFFVVPAGAQSRRAQGSDVDLKPVPAWTYDALAGAGGLVSSARDQLALVDAELDATAGGRRPLRPAMRLTQEAQLEGTRDNASLGWNIDSQGRY